MLPSFPIFAYPWDTYMARSSAGTCSSPQCYCPHACLLSRFVSLVLQKTALLDSHKRFTCTFAARWHPYMLEWENEQLCCWHVADSTSRAHVKCRSSFAFRVIHECEIVLFLLYCCEDSRRWQRQNSHRRFVLSSWVGEADETYGYLIWRYWEQAEEDTMISIASCFWEKKRTKNHIQPVQSACFWKDVEPEQPWYMSDLVFGQTMAHILDCFVGIWKWIMY